MRYKRIGTGIEPERLVESLVYGGQPVVIWIDDVLIVPIVDDGQVLVVGLLAFLRHLLVVVVLERAGSHNRCVDVVICERVIELVGIPGVAILEVPAVDQVRSVVSVRYGGELERFVDVVVPGETAIKDTVDELLVAERRMPRRDAELRGVVFESGHHDMPRGVIRPTVLTLDADLTVLVDEVSDIRGVVVPVWTQHGIDVVEQLQQPMVAIYASEQIVYVGRCRHHYRWLAALHAIRAQHGSRRHVRTPMAYRAVCVLHGHSYLTYGHVDLRICG